MAFFLRKTVKQKGLYLQICETVYNKETKLSSNRNVKVLGYADSYLDQFPDPSFKSYSQHLRCQARS